MIGWIALALGSLGVGLGLVALFGSTFVRAHRAEVWRRELDRAFGAGYVAGKADGERKVT